MIAVILFGVWLGYLGRAIVAGLTDSYIDVSSWWQVAIALILIPFTVYPVLADLYRQGKAPKPGPTPPQGSSTAPSRSLARRWSTCGSRRAPFCILPDPYTSTLVTGTTRPLRLSRQTLRKWLDRK